MTNNNKRIRFSGWLLVSLIFWVLCGVVAAQIKITALPAASAVTTDDLLMIVDAPGGSAVTQKITVANFKTSIFTSPTLVTPTLGVALATSINGNIFTVGSSTYTGTAGQTYTFPTTTAVIARTDAGQTFTGTQAFGAITASGVITQTSASATAFASGPNGATNPVLLLVNNTASQADGVSITGLAAGSGTTFTGLSSGSNAGFTFTPKGTGTTTFTTGQVIAGATGGSGGFVLGAAGPGLRGNSTRVWVSDNGDSAFVPFTAIAFFINSVTDTTIQRAAANNFRFGLADAAAPVAQTLSVQNVVTGTSNTAGANFTIAGSQSTGNAAGGSIIFQTSPLGGSGTSVNALATAMSVLGAGTVSLVKTVSTYNNIATAGLGLPAIYSAPAISATKTANFTVLSLTPPATAGTYRVNGIITTTSSTNTGTVQFTLDYVDSQGTTHTADIIPLCDAAGVIATTKTGASKEFHATDWMFTINNAATAIALKVVITGSVSYTTSGSIEQIN